MTSRRRGWDWWSEVKLSILAAYLGGFTTACSGKSLEITCLDLFGGDYDNQRRHEAGTFPGSTRIALETDPPFTRLAFFELPDKASALNAAIKAARPTDERWRVFPGDCNEHLAGALAWLDPVRWAPTFAFLDPKGLQVAWTTIEMLSRWRADKKTKVELWMLFPEPALARVLGLRGVRGRRSAEKLDRLYGCHDWVAIHQLRRDERLDPDEMRAEFVNLLRWRLENVLKYRTTHALQLVDTRGHPVYTLVFATDSQPGSEIMKHVYGNAAMKTIPAMQTRARAAQRQREAAGRGVTPLFEYDTAPGAPKLGGGYDHVPPWQPPSGLAKLDLDNEPDIDPDDLDVEAWADQLDDEDD